MSAVRGITVLDLDVAGGNQLSSPQQFWYVEHKLVQLIGGTVRSHGPPPHAPPPPMVTGSHWFTINDIPVCRQGDVPVCGCPTTGRPWFFIT